MNETGLKYLFQGAKLSHRLLELLVLRVNLRLKSGALLLHHVQEQHRAQERAWRHPKLPCETHHLITDMLDGVSIVYYKESTNREQNNWQYRIMSSRRQVILTSAG